MRDPLADPMPGDVFRNKGGTTFAVVDRFVSTGKPGAEMPGYFIRSVRKGGGESYGSTAIVILRHRKKSWAVVNAAAVNAEPWDTVPRHPHNEVDTIMRRKHGVPPSAKKRVTK